MNYQELLNRFPPSTQNNARSIVGNLLTLFMEKPSQGIEKRLNKLGIGVNWTKLDHDDYQKPEDFFLTDSVEVERLTDRELADIF